MKSGEQRAEFEEQKNYMLLVYSSEKKGLILWNFENFVAKFSYID